MGNFILCTVFLSKKFEQRIQDALQIKYYFLKSWSRKIVEPNVLHCVKSVRFRSYSGPYFPAFGMNTERYSVSLRNQSECGKYGPE